MADKALAKVEDGAACEIKCPTVTQTPTTLSEVSPDDDTITILVGEGEDAFKVDRTQLCASSDFFRLALHGDFSEAKDGKVKLVDGEASSFKVYATWLNGGAISSPYNPKPCEDDDFDEMADVLILADLVQDDNYYNAIIDSLITVSDHTLPSSMAAKLYKRLPESSPIFRLLIDFWVHQSSRSWFEDSGSRDVEGAPSAFWVAVAKGLAEKARFGKIGYDEPWQNNRCKYHKRCCAGRI